LRAWVDLAPLSGAGLSPAALDEAIHAALDNCEGGIDDKIVRLVVRDVPRHILRDLDHKSLREYKRRALHFNLDTRRPEIVRPEKGQGAPGRRASLADTVRDLDERPRDGNGFSFTQYDRAAFSGALARALRAYRRDGDLWNELRGRAMHEDHSWTASAKQYVDVYKLAQKRHRG
jgi:hypothetical protein